MKFKKLFGFRFVNKKVENDIDNAILMLNRIPNLKVWIKRAHETTMFDVAGATKLVFVADRSPTEELSSRYLKWSRTFFNDDSLKRFLVRGMKTEGVGVLKFDYEDFEKYVKPHVPEYSSLAELDMKLKLMGF